jgi:hypothetical protein
MYKVPFDLGILRIVPHTKGISSSDMRKNKLIKISNNQNE